MSSRRPKIQAINNKVQNLINNAHWYWSKAEGRNRTSYKEMGVGLQPESENNRRAYTNIRGAPTVTFTSDAQIWSFLKKLGYTHPSNILHYVSNTGKGARIPKHRKLYIMPWIFVPGPRSIVEGTFRYKPPHGSERLALFNKGVVNKFITERSLTQPNLPAGTTLRQARSFIRATNKLSNILGTMRRKKQSNVALTAAFREGLRRRRIYREGLNTIRRKYGTS